MFRFIFNSLLLFFLLIGIVTVFASEDFDVEMGDEDYKTTHSLSAVGRQKGNGDPTGGYHRAAFNLKTTLPSFNPDRSGAKSVVCKMGANGKRKITFSLRDKKAVEDVKRWPKKVMLLISHKWKCFGKRSTQFFTATDRVIDESRLTATMAIMRCDYPYYSDDFSLDVNWIEGKQSKNNTRRNLEERFGIPFPTINISNKIGLNALFDSETGKSSKPDLNIINQNDIKLVCTNCFTKGEATIALRVKGKVFPPKIDDASITLSGNFLMNLDFSLEGSKGKSLNDRKKGSKNSSINDLVLLSIGLGPFNIPGILNLGPSIDLVAEADVTAETTGIVEFGGDLSLPNFNAVASFKGTPSFQQSGFKPDVNAHKPTADVKISASISASLKPQLAFGVDILNGRVLRQKVGFELVGTLENSFSIGTCKRKTDPRLESSLTGNLGFFVNDDDFPIVEFPSLTLLDKCL